MQTKYDLAAMSSQQLEALAKLAAALAADRRGAEPSYKLALAAGVQDVGYSDRVGGSGWVTSYSGEAVVTLEDGSRWRCIGHGVQGGPDWIGRHGWIEFVPIAAEATGSPQTEDSEMEKNEYLELEALVVALHRNDPKGGYDPLAREEEDRND